MVSRCVRIGGHVETLFGALALPLSLSTFVQTDNEGCITIVSMQSPIKTGPSVEKVFEAEAELLAHVQSGSRNPQQQKQLARAVQSAIDESSGQRTKPLATRSEFNPARRRHSF